MKMTPQLADAIERCSDDELDLIAEPFVQLAEEARASGSPAAGAGNRNAARVARRAAGILDAVVKELRLTRRVRDRKEGKR